MLAMLSLLGTMSIATFALPRLLSPADGEVLYCARDGATPELTWDAGPIPRAVDGLPDTVIELSASSNFSSVVFLARDKVPAIIERYVRAQPLELVPQTLRAVYYWRVGRPSGSSGSTIVWSTARSFQLRIPGRQTSVPASMTSWAAVQGLIASTAAASSAAQLDSTTA